jgi:hypothetical protein
MIIETVITTINELGRIHFSAVGVKFFKSKALFDLYKKSDTFENLKIKDYGIINIVDKAEYFIKAALSSEKIDISEIKKNELYYLTDCCSYYHFKVLKIKDCGRKYRVEVKILRKKENRKYIGFNRANNLLLEAAIIASRIGITKNKNDLKKFLENNKRIIFKTGDKNTKKLLKFLEEI